MRTRFLCAIAMLAACSTTDDRPKTLAYITEAVLTPYCSGAECHSSAKRQSSYVFDSVAAAQASIASGALVDVCAAPPCDDSPGRSFLLTVITQKDTFGNRMPLDEPLPNLDSVLIAEWIRAGSPGYVPPAAP